MDRSTPRLLLLEESIKMSKFGLKATADGEELCDWTRVETKKSMGHLMNQPVNKGKKNNLKRTEQSFSPGKINKGLRLLNRRTISPTTQWSRNRDSLQLKFEHFSSSSEFIEQYRKAKLARLEEVFNKLIKQKEEASELLTDKYKDHTEKQDVRPCSTASSSSETSQAELRSRVQSGDLVKPSLPRSGYFTGKKWAYTNNVSPNHPRYGGRRHTGASFHGTKHDVQALNTGNMCLKGIGKPLYNSLNKTWTVPLSRSSTCKSAPSTNERSWKNVLSPRQKPQSIHAPEEVESNTESPSQNFIDFSSLSQGPKVTKFVPTTERYHTFDHLRKVEETSEQNVNNQQCLDYENMFKEVIDFYGYKQDKSIKIRT